MQLLEKEKDLEKEKKNLLFKEIEEAKDKKKKIIIKQRIIEKKAMRQREQYI